MDDVDLHEFRFPRRVAAKSTSLVSASAQTNPMERRDAETSACSGVDRQTQTEFEATSNAKVEIDPKVVERMLAALGENKTANFDRLSSFHVRENVRLEQISVFNIDTVLIGADVDVIGIRYGSSRRVLILLGSSSHETFCSHQSRLLLATNSTSNTIPLSVCPFSATFRTATQFVVGDISGKVSFFAGQNLVMEHKLHNSNVTSLDFSQFGLLSSSDDGELKLSQVTTSELLPVKSVQLGVADLPRNICKTSTTGKRVAIVSVQRSGSEAVVATETGGVWVARLPTLTLRCLPLPAQPIHTVLFVSPFIVVCSQGQPAVVLTVDAFVDQLPICATLAVRCGQHFVLSDKKRLVIWSSVTRKVCYDAKFECKALTSSPPDTLIFLDEANRISNWRINFD